jgi:hypothetical protein
MDDQVEMSETEKKDVKEQVQAAGMVDIGRHDYFYNGGDTCKVCNVSFDDHPHRLAYLQKAIAQANGKTWKKCTFRERQAFKMAVAAWMASQLERMMKPFVESVEKGPETPTPSTT